MIPKFRAFNKKTKKMYSIDGFKASERKIYRCSLADDEFRSGRLETFHFVEDNLDDYILMQSTGLQDCYQYTLVKYDKDKLAFVLYDGCERLYHELWEPGEVIGNIYENPKLLESVEE
ncbi:YopX family protein [Streptococcus pyogenes]|uniref:YopX family protein n=1 Tax=Streptococcus pyogenes TaxID=1314 RepID=UPI000DA34924|nr:YopX family protein [Streptococcus pyogenes]SQH10274.1 phage protein [Streptococcus pyogenes]